MHSNFKLYTMTVHSSLSNCRNTENNDDWGRNGDGSSSSGGGEVKTRETTWEFVEGKMTQ